MTTINRENLLNDLNLVKAGLSPRELIEQSSCLVFSDGWVFTFNDEIACRKKVDLPITGAVQATPLFAILEKLDDTDLKVRENEKGELEFRGKGKGFAVTRDKEIFLPIDRVEMPEKWKTLPKEFTEAVSLVQHCVSTDESKFLLSCIHIAPNFIESCDNLQILRYEVETSMKDDVLVRGTSLAHISSLAMDKVCLTESWIHFKNQQGLIFSCRRFEENYPNLDKVLAFKGHAIVIPKGLAEASARAAVFAADKAGEPLLKVSLKDERVRITGEGLTGWYKEVKKVTYKGPPMEFMIAPELLKHISEKYSDAQLTEDKLKVEGERWKYCTVLGVPDTQPSDNKDE